MLRRSLWLISLTFFVGVYVLSVSTYTYIASLGNVNFPEQVRVKRDIANEEVNTTALANVTKLKPEYQDENTNKITLNICCDENKVLDDRYECVEWKVNNTTDEYPSKGKLITETLVLNEELEPSQINPSRLELRYEGFRNHCSIEDASVFKWTPNKSENYFISQETGYLLEIDEDEQNVSTSFPPESYCVDVNLPINRSFVALVCSCGDVCINKCCKVGYYYNEKLKECKEADSDNIQEYQPTFYHLDKQAEEVLYFLKHGYPNCSSPVTSIKKNINDSVPFYIQGALKGALMLSNENDDVYNFYDNGRFCVDIFSDGSPNHTYVNGFFCPGSNVRFIYNKTADLEKAEKLDIKADVKVEEIRRTTFGPENEKLAVKAEGHAYLTDGKYFTYYFTVLAMLSNNIYYLIMA